MRCPVFDQSIDRFARRWSAIDVIAQENVNRSRRRTERNIGVDPGQQIIEQIQTSVDIADGIDPSICRQRWTPPLHSEFRKPRKRKQHRQLAIAKRIPWRWQIQSISILDL